MLPYIFLSHDISLASYNVFAGIGMIFAFLCMENQLNKQNTPDKDISVIYISAVVSLLAGFAGAFLFDAMALGKFGMIEGVGLTFYGGLIGGGLSFIICSVLFKIRILHTLNVLTPSVVLAHAIGRVGCFLAGCCYGAPTDLPWGIVFPETSFPSIQYHAAPLHPTQLYETFFLLALFCVLIRTAVFQYRVTAYLLLYGLFRFFIEYVRADERGVIAGQTWFSPSQIISMGLVAVGILLLCHKQKFCLQEQDGLKSKLIYK